MEHQANAATSAQSNEPQTIDADDNSPHSVDRPLITPKEFIRLIYTLSGAAIVVLSLAIWFMMSLA
ncbi:MAG: hypothetical protein LW709_04510 [Oxalobacteraceae bacterium]|jgi:hypothetical protein|nr:hypothetical protein [Oxalobacteraceae bacterium]